MKVPLQRIARAGFALALAILTAIAAISYLSITGFIDAARSMEETEQAIDMMQDLNTSITAVESAARGVVLSGKDSYIEPFRSAELRVIAHLSDLQALVADNPRLGPWIPNLERLLKEKVDYHRRMIALRREKGFEAGNQFFLTGRGHELMDSIENTLGNLIAEEKRLLNRRAAHSRMHADIAIPALLGGTMLSFAMLGFVYFRLDREVAMGCQSEGNLRRLNRLYGVLSQVSQAVVRVRTRTELLKEVCRITVEQGRFPMAWIGEADFESGMVIPVAECGAGDYLQHVRVTFKDEPEGKGPTGSSVRLGKRVICNDVQTDLRILPWREELLARGYHSLGAFPILAEGRLAAVFTVYAREAAFFDESNVSLLDEVSAELALALERMEQEARRKKAEEELQRQARIIDQVHDSVITTDLDGFVMSWNDGAQHLTGYSRAESIGRHISFLYGADDGGVLENEVIQPLRAKGSHEVEVRMVRKSGDLVYAHLALSLLQDKNGNVSGMIGYGTDVTDAKRAESALKESEERFRQMAENIEEMLWMSTGDFSSVLYVSAAYERIWGRTRESLYEDARSFLDAIHPEDQESVRQRFARALEKEHWNEEYRIVQPGGEVRWVWDRAFPVRDGTGRIYRWVGITQDLTERKATEQEIRRLNENLERRVEERTLELGRVNAELERVSRMKSDFLARISHELRTPMNAIMGFGDLLAEEGEGPLEPVYRNFVQHIRDGARHLLELINDLLDLSRIEAGRLELHPEVIEVSEALDEVCSVIAPLAQTRSIGLQEDISATVKVLADRTRFKQVLYNLLSNAVKFTPEGGDVRVACSRDGDLVRFVVSDTGVGIAAEEQTAIFEEFHQAAAGRKGTEGTGLGLAITRKLVEQHGGRIWVESAPGCGSRFHFTLRAGPEQPATAHKPEDVLVLIAGTDARACDMVSECLLAQGRRTTRDPLCPDANVLAAVVRPGEQPSVVIDAQPVMLPVVSVWLDPECCEGTALHAAGFLEKSALQPSLPILLRVFSGGAVVLVASDRESVLMISHMSLHAGCTPVPVRNVDEILDAMASKHVDALIVDLSVGQLNGAAVLRTLLLSADARGVRVFMVTGPGTHPETGDHWRQQLSTELARAVAAGTYAETTRCGR